jgi:UDP-N-acetylmuramyl pentapeptide phosphotransferase/UDP-N-acetylglucosamine-1-phosphate transferase
MMISIVISISAFLFACLLVVQVIPQIILVTAKKRLFDVPGGRKAHAIPTPTAGGIAIFIGIFISLLTFSMGKGIDAFHPLLISLIILFFLGLKDDLIGAKASRKLLIQVILAGVLTLGGFQLDGFWEMLGLMNLPFLLKFGGSIFLVVFLTNAYNMIDGIDGLAGGIGMISSLAFGVVLMLRGDMLFAILAFSTAGSLLGFLKFNFQPARIFMGDTGSLVVGFILSALMLQVLEGSAVPGAKLAAIGPFVVLAALAVPVTDLIQVVVSRLAAGSHPFSADRRHLHHKLLNIGLSHSKAMYLLCGVTFSLILFTFFMANVAIWVGLFNLASFIVCLLLVLYILHDNKIVLSKGNAIFK